MTEPLTIDTLMRAAVEVRRYSVPRFFAGSRIAIDAFIQREYQGTWIQTPPMVNQPTTVAGVPVEISTALPRWAFAIVEPTGGMTLYDLEYGVNIKGTNKSLPVEVALLLGVEHLKKQRDDWARAGNAPALSRLEEPGPDPQTPAMGSLPPSNPY